MSRKMSVTIDVIRSITEIWYFDIEKIDARDLIPPVEIGLGVYYHGSGG
jgi:hypothetical protein